jgi:hypothetical protein
VLARILKRKNMRRKKRIECGRDGLVRERRGNGIRG